MINGKTTLAAAIVAAAVAGGDSVFTWKVNEKTSALKEEQARQDERIKSIEKMEKMVRELHEHILINKGKEAERNARDRPQ